VILGELAAARVVHCAADAPLDRLLATLLIAPGGVAALTDGRSQRDPLRAHLAGWAAERKASRDAAS
jgi:hypothetical protein